MRVTTATHDATGGPAAPTARGNQSLREVTSRAGVAGDRDIDVVNRRATVRGPVELVRRAIAVPCLETTTRGALAGLTTP